MRCGIAPAELRDLGANEARALVEMIDWEEADRLRGIAKKAMAVLDIGGIG